VVPSFHFDWRDDALYLVEDLTVLGGDLASIRPFVEMQKLGR
jgi:hypothetical protein